MPQPLQHCVEGDQIEHSDAVNRHKTPNMKQSSIPGPHPTSNRSFVSVRDSHTFKSVASVRTAFVVLLPSSLLMHLGSRQPRCHSFSFFAQPTWRDGRRVWGRVWGGRGAIFEATKEGPPRFACHPSARARRRGQSPVARAPVTKLEAAMAAVGETDPH